jgi:hypothetical protein
MWSLPLEMGDILEGVVRLECMFLIKNALSVLYKQTKQYNE